MPPRCLIAAALFIATGLQAGCALFQPIQEVSYHTWRGFRPKGHDYRDVTEEANDEWSSVGTEARGNSPLEKGGDPLYSSKARSIERNLGVGL